MPFSFLLFSHLRGRSALWQLSQTLSVPFSQTGKWGLSSFLFILVWFHFSLCNLCAVHWLGVSLSSASGNVKTFGTDSTSVPTFLFGISWAPSSSLGNESCLTLTDFTVSHQEKLLISSRWVWVLENLANVIRNDIPASFSLPGFF